MKAVILAAGVGSRLRPLTDNVPKCMIEVNGIKIIDRQIKNLVLNGIMDIVIITGYQSRILESYVKQKYSSVKCIENARYSETNNMYSLFLAYDYLKDDDFMILNADVYFDSGIIGGMINHPFSNSIACDTNVYIEESMKVTMSESIQHISKQISKSEYYAVSIDIYKISSESAKSLFKVMTEFICEQKNENLWTEVALDKIFKIEKFMPYLIKGRWLEIDNHADLEQAQILFKGDSLCS